MKFPVLWLSFVSALTGTGKVTCLAWDLVSPSHITLHFCAKTVLNLPGADNIAMNFVGKWTFHINQKVISQIKQK